MSKTFFAFHCGDMRVEENQIRVTTESQPLPGIEHATFRSQVRISTNLAISYPKPHRYKDECYTHFRLRGYIVLESGCLPWNTSACRRPSACRCPQSADNWLSPFVSHGSHGPSPCSRTTLHPGTSHTQLPVSPYHRHGKRPSKCFGLASVPHR